MLNSSSEKKPFSRQRGGSRREEKRGDLDQKVIDIARVTRVTKGGKRFSFRATVVVGNKNGKVGVGVAQGRDVAQAIQKAAFQGEKNVIKVVIKDSTIPHAVQSKFNSAVVLLKPATIGSGIKAGGSVRAVAQLGGIENVTSKLLSRTNNKINVARATIEALKKLRKV